MAQFEHPEFLAEFLATFIAEAKEYLNQLSEGLLKLEKQPNQPEVIDALFRAAHTLKGGSAMMGYDSIESVAHRLEDLFEPLREGKQSLSSELTTNALGAVDLMARALTFVEGGQAIPPGLATLCKTLDLALSIPVVAEEIVEKAAAPKSVDEVIRVPLSRVNTLLNLAGELVINRVKSSSKLATLRDLARNVRVLQKRIAVVVEQIGEASRTGLPPTAELLAPLAHECALEAEKLKETLAEFSEPLITETVHVDSVIDELQFKVKQLRMLPCETIFNGCERIVRDAASQEGKQTSLVISGEQAELDKKVLEAIKPCLIHLLRNAVSHGIELPDARKASGKSPAGTIWLRATQQNDRVIIEVQDDGAGINLERVKQTALKRQLVKEQALQRMSDSEIMSLIFEPGFSTSTSVTDVSGRGVGLDVVRLEIEKLKGRLHVASQLGQGSVVRIELPLSVAVLRVLSVDAAGHRFGIPLSFVEAVARIDPKTVQTIEQRMAISLHDRAVALIFLSDVLQLPVGDGHEAQSSSVNGANGAGHWPVVVVNILEKRVGFVVDQVLGDEEVFLKPLGEHLGKVPHVMGATILGSGELLVILDAADLMRSAQGPQQARTVKKSTQPPPRRRILVVEDSLMMRELERSILESSGYLVETAVDGLDALEKLSQAPVDLIVCDIEMPRMNGLEFCQTLRQRAEYQALPLIFLTTRNTDEEKRRGLEVGAQAYLVKSAFHQATLLQAINRFIG